jgi:hypothetical protein
MRPAPREPSKQFNAKSLPVTKRRAASGVRLSAQQGFRGQYQRKPGLSTPAASDFYRTRVPVVMVLVL